MSPSAMRLGSILSWPDAKASRIWLTRATLISLSLFCKLDRWRAVGLRSTAPLLAAGDDDVLALVTPSVREPVTVLLAGLLIEGEVIFKRVSG